MFLEYVVKAPGKKKVRTYVGSQHGENTYFGVKYITDQKNVFLFF